MFINKRSNLASLSSGGRLATTQNVVCMFPYEKVSNWSNWRMRKSPNLGAN